jgi:hypothetical protein
LQNQNGLKDSKKQKPFFGTENASQLIVTCRLQLSEQGKYYPEETKGNKYRKKQQY